VAEKALAQNLGQPSLIALATTIERKRGDYYAALQLDNKAVEITNWMKYFANTIIEAQISTIKRVDFYAMAATNFLSSCSPLLPERR
jgi:Fic family protein